MNNVDAQTHLVILAAGLGSRLAPLTNNIPKFLVNIGKNTGYVEMIRYWVKQYPVMKQGSLLTVIVHSAYKDLVQAYHDMYFPDVAITIKTVDVANGSAHAIDSTCEHLDGKSVLFSWCDVLPIDDIDHKQISNGRMFNYGTIFTNYKNSNRYGLEKIGETNFVRAVLDPNERGGCFGLYHIPNFKIGIDYKNGEDFIDVIHQYVDNIKESRIENIIDFGDMPKLIRTRSQADEAREFNSIKFIGDYVFKEATNAQGKAIIAKEIDWYSKLESFAKLEQLFEGNHRPDVPKTWFAEDKKSFFMSLVKGEAIYKVWNDISDVDRHYVLSQLIEQQRKLFDLPYKYRLDANFNFTSTVKLRDVSIESGDKLVKRYNEIEHMIKSFGEVTSVNRYVLKNKNPLDTIRQLSKVIYEYYVNNPEIKYGFIHGDLQFSNSLVDVDTMKVSIIDPRGYFGETKGAGLADYDIGKLLYALSGYDTFNSSKTFHIKELKDGNIEFDIGIPTYGGVEKLIADHFQPIHYAWCAVNFIGLAQYVKSDPIKSLAAHYHGLALAENILGL